MGRSALTRSKITELREAAITAQPHEKQDGITLREAVEELADVLRDMRSTRSYSISALVTWFADQNVEISASTLRGYLANAPLSQPTAAAPRQSRGAGGSRRRGSRTAARSNSAETAGPAPASSSEVPSGTSSNSSTGADDSTKGFAGLKISEHAR